MEVVFIGSGNVATHLAKALKNNGYNLKQVWSRTTSHAAFLAEAVAAQPISEIDQIDRNADMYIIAVKDDCIAEIAQSLHGVRGLVVHTSGATPMEVLKDLNSHGVLYPLQTFSKSRAISFSQVPLFIEAVDATSLAALKLLADELSTMVYEVDTEKRKILHLAAVFACNFVNQLYTLSDELVAQHGLKFEMLRPLIMETALKVQSAKPVEVQTGPAIRNDQQTMSRHLSLLSAMPELAQLYETLSNSIKKTHS